MSMDPVTQQPSGEFSEDLERVWERRPGFRGWLGEVNQTRIGVRFIVTALVFMLIGGALALLMRVQLAVPDNDFLDPQLYNELFTMHGTTMMFLFAVPILEGIAIYLLAPMLGTRDLPLPRVSAFGYWCYLFGGILLYSSFIFGAAPDGGWFAYTPLTGPEFSPGNALDFWLLGVTFVEISAVVTAVEIVAMLLLFRPPGMTLARIPIFGWSMFVTAFMILIAFPPLILGGILLELDRAMGTVFYDPNLGGNPLLWQHLFWFFGHPEVYIILLPSVGMVSMIVPAFARRPIVGYLPIVISLVAIGILSFGLWVHHMFTTGQAILGAHFFTAASLLIAVPSGIQVFAWLATLMMGRVSWRAPIKWVAGFVFVFVMGGITGVMVAVVPFNWQVHDTHFVTAHFHYVLIGGMLFPLFAGITYWFPKVTGRMMSERLGTVSFWLVFAGINITFFPLHQLGFLGMTRRVYTYQEGFGWGTLNMVSTVGAFMMALGVAVLVGNAAYSGLKGRPAGGNPWGAGTLEWGLGSPPLPHGPDQISGVTTREPLWEPDGLVDLPEPMRLDQLDGDHREVLTTTIIDAQPRAIVTLPQHSLMPLCASLSIAVSLIGVLAETYWLSILGAIAVVISIGVWLWPGGPDWGPDHGGHHERPPTRPLSDETPAGRATTWYVTLLSLTVLGAGYGALLFTYFYLRLDEPAWPPDGLPAPDPWLPSIAGVLLLATGGVLWWAMRQAHRLRVARARLGLLTAAALGAAAAGCQAASLWLLDLDPGTHSYASVVVVLGWAIVLLLATGVPFLLAVVARSRTEPLHTGSTAGADEALTWWSGVAGASIIGIIVLTTSPYVL